MELLMKSRIVKGNSTNRLQKVGRLCYGTNLKPTYSTLLPYKN